MSDSLDADSTEFAKRKVAELPAGLNRTQRELLFWAFKTGYTDGVVAEFMRISNERRLRISA